MAVPVFGWETAGGSDGGVASVFDIDYGFLIM
jgi:hypothetical protein